MSEVKQCPECGAEMPSGALARLCPRCLLAVGLERSDDRDRSLSGESDAPTTPHSGSFVPPSPVELAAHFPHLEILDLVGYGGMGAVYKARQRHLDRVVALKIIRPESANTPSFAERFNREARLLARLSHPHIVAVYDFGRVDIALPELDSSAERAETTRPLFYFLMEYVDGANLRELLRDGDLTPPQSLSIVPQICEALQFAHDEGVVHRDIKPENILLDKRGRVKIADFGLAKLAAGSTEDYSLTGTHQVMGTPRYMAPEQMEGSHAVDHRADIFSLGVVFYEMLTGEVPAGHFEPPSKKVEIDVRLDEVVLRSLARDPERRYQQASEIKFEVDEITTRQKIHGAPSAPRRSFYWTPSWKLYTAYSAIFAGMLYSLFAAVYGTTFGLSGTGVLANIAAISASSLLGLAIEKLSSSAGTSWRDRRNLATLLLALLMSLTPVMVLSPVELKAWLPASVVAFTDREEQWLRIVGWGMFLWTFYFTSAHVWVPLPRRAGRRGKSDNDMVGGGLVHEPKRLYQQASEAKINVDRGRSCPIGTTPLPGAATVDEAEDFLLMNPRLPVAAQWITVYAIVVRPALWILAMMFVVLGLEASLDFDSTDAVIPNAEAVIDTSIELLAGIFQLAFVVMVAIGGFKLRVLRRGAVGWLQLGLALGVGLGLLVFILQLTFTPVRIELLREIARTNPARLRADNFTQQEIDAILTDRESPIFVPEVIGAFIGFSWLVLDIVVFTWLWRNRGRLPLHEKPPSANRKLDDRALSEPRLSKMAIASVIATLPAVFVLGYLYMVTTQRGIPEFLRLIRAPDFGEVAVAFFFLPGVIGTALGAAALYRIRNSQGRSLGTWLAAAGASFYPILAFNALIAPLIASASHVGLGFDNLAHEQLGGPKSQILIWSILLTLAAIDYFIVRKLWPRLTRFDSSLSLRDATENLPSDSASPLRQAQDGDSASAATPTSNTHTADEQARPRGTLRRAWDDCWAERDRTLTLFVQTTMGLTFAFCLIAFLSFHVNIKNVPDAKGQPIRHTIVVCGQSSSPWFRSEMNAAGNPGGKWEVILNSWSSATMLVGFVAWGVMWEIEKARQKAVGKQPRWWNGSPILALSLWALGTTISLVAAFLMVSLR